MPVDVAEGRFVFLAVVAVAGGAAAAGAAEGKECLACMFVCFEGYWCV